MGLRAIRLVRDQQAYAQAFLDCFWVFTLIALAIVPLTLPDEAVGGRGRGAPRRVTDETERLSRRAAAFRYFWPPAGSSPIS